MTIEAMMLKDFARKLAMPITKRIDARIATQVSQRLAMLESQTRERFVSVEGKLLERLMAAERASSALSELKTQVGRVEV